MAMVAREIHLGAEIGWGVKYFLDAYFSSCARRATCLRCSPFSAPPEAIKMAPVIAELEKYPALIENKTALTGQHKDMVAPLIDLQDSRRL